MERKNDKTIFLLIAAGLGIYWLLKRQSVPPATTSVIAPSMPEIAPVVSNPDDLISTQPIYEQPIYEQPTQEQFVEYTPITDMFNLMSSGGNKTQDKVE